MIRGVVVVYSGCEISIPAATSLHCHADVGLGDHRHIAGTVQLVDQVRIRHAATIVEGQGGRASWKGFRRLRSGRRQCDRGERDRHGQHRQ
jgi:hypothetical protein